MTDSTFVFIEPTIIQGDARALSLPDNNVDLVVTSPPYFGLRSYRDGQAPYRGQLGAEDTPGEYLDYLITCTREMIRVLKPSGSLFINLGDKYSGHNNGSGKRRSLNGDHGTARMSDEDNPRRYGVSAKSLIGLPWRYALRCVDELGVILRAEIIWSKPTGQPESVRDRVRRSHETWFHFTLHPRYYSAIDEIREPRAPVTPAQYRTGRRPSTRDGPRRQPVPSRTRRHPRRTSREPAGQATRVGLVHHGSTTTCTQARGCRALRGILTRHEPSTHRAAPARRGHPAEQLVAEARAALGSYAREFLLSRATDFADACDCADIHAPSVPGVVLDPFGGTGTTALAASVQGRHGISVDASRDYSGLAAWRTHDPHQQARARGTNPPQRAQQQLRRPWHAPCNTPRRAVTRALRRSTRSGPPLFADRRYDFGPASTDLTSGQGKGTEEIGMPDFENNRPASNDKTRRRATPHQNLLPEETNDAVVIPFPQREANTTADSDNIKWHYVQQFRGRQRTFTGEVAYIGGAEGQRVREELVASIADLLRWASDQQDLPNRPAEGKRNQAA